MPPLQPVKKSLGNYILVGYTFATSRKLTPKQKYLVKEVSESDTAVLIIDDIFDQSLLRNKKPCLYREVGLKKAFLISQEKIFSSFEALKELTFSLKLNYHFQLECFNALQKELEDILKGERICDNLEGKKNFNQKLLKDYLKMVRLFTGGHIKGGLNIGQLLAKRKPNKKLEKIAISLGIIRQIYDDFNDYFLEHHEPFGDFVRQENRLPELLFKKNKGKRNLVIKEIKNENYKKARNLVLTREVRNELYGYCKKEEEKIKKIKIKFNYRVLMEDYSEILKKQNP